MPPPYCEKLGIEEVLTTASASSEAFLQTSVKMKPAVATVIIATLVFLGPTPAFAQFTMTGGKNGILGIYLSAGGILRVAPGTTLTIGATYTEVRQVEPLIAVTTTVPMGRGWNVALTTSYGGIGGDYRVERLPEVSFTKGDRVPDTALTYNVDLGAGNYTVWPSSLSGYRVHGAVRLNTPSMPLGRTVRTSAAVGYTQYFYSTNTHAAWWGLVQITFAPAPIFSTSFTYYRQIPSGSSPLLFDGIGQENYVSGGFSVRPMQLLTLGHSQIYSFLTSSITARVYEASVALKGGHVVGASWNDVERKVTLSYARSGFGSFSIFWYP